VTVRGAERWGAAIRGAAVCGAARWGAGRAAGAAFSDWPLLSCCCCAEKSVLVADRSCATLCTPGANIMVAASRPALIRLMRVKSILLVMASPRCFDASLLNRHSLETQIAKY